MSIRDDDRGFGAVGALGLADSLSTLRLMLDAARCDSEADLVAAAVEALVQHQDFDGCAVITAGADGLGAGAPGQRVATRLPDFLDPIVAAEVIPTLLDEGAVYREVRLVDRGRGARGSVLAVPVSDGHRVTDGLVVWSEDADAFMPWHQVLLEMLAEVFALILARLPGDESTGQGAAVESRVPQLTPTESLGALAPFAGLDGRRTFELGIEELAVAPPSGLRSRYILFVDIDRFRLIREYGGDMTAERMIRVFSELLHREMDGEKLIGRLGADKFAVVVERRSREQALQLAESLVGLVDSLRLTFFGQRYDVSISIGVAELKSGYGSGLAALRHAMQACQAAQKQGGGTVLGYHDNLTVPRRSRSEGRLLNRLTRALKDDDLELYAQLIAPLGDAGNASNAPPCMHELLLRMRDDEGELIGAGAFLTVAERYGLSVKLDRWVIRRAFSQIANAACPDDPEHRFTLNLSGHSIDDHSLLDFIVAQFGASGLAPHRICFEITETAAISDIGAAKRFVEELKKIGCEFALDDFGSGHSSFLYLRDLPIDYLKIDGELVREIADDPVSMAFVRTIEGVARLMGRQTIAECVENDAIRDAIAEIGCNYMQGYLVGSPVPLSEILQGGTA